MGSIRRSKTKRRTRDIDQIHADLRSAKHLAQHQKAKPEEDLPGLGQWYCVECAKWFEGEHSLIEHRKGKRHKRRVRFLREEPYSQKEAEAAIGLQPDIGLRKGTKLGSPVQEDTPMDVASTELEDSQRSQ